MKYEEFVRKFKSQCAVLSRDKQLSLAIEICKNLFFDYQKFSAENEWGDPDLLLDAINLADKSRSQEIRLEYVKLLLPKIDQVIPDTDDFGNASYALNASAAVYETLEFMVDNDSIHIENIGTYFMDTVDAKIQEDGDLSMDEIDKHHLMIKTRKFLIESTQ